MDKSGTGIQPQGQSKQEIDMEDKIKKLEKQVKTLTGLSMLLLVAVVLSIVIVPSRVDDDDILRVKGIIVEDEAGRERILIGAPVPPASNRIRTDTSRVREIWGPRFPKKYMEYYKGYSHAANGILILDEKGFDRIAIGSPTPDPNIGKRIGQGTGIQINDEEGFERTGYGMLNVDGFNRIVLGLDGKSGMEALMLSVDDSDGSIGLSVHNGQNMVFVGHNDASGIQPEGARNFNGILLKDSVNFKQLDARKEK